MNDKSSSNGIIYPHIQQQDDSPTKNPSASHHPEQAAILPQEKYQEVDITFKDIKYTVHTKSGPKQLLKGVDGICKAGTITAILGSSGAGKTTLLNILCQRVQNKRGSELSGDIRANNNKFNQEEFAQFGAYVMQDDVLLETMTVRECLEFAANLKTKGTEKDKEHKVEQMIRNLHLERCQNTFIGGVFLKGVSGGEKKRTSIGYEMISDPAALFLDEPTSGLDSFTAYSIIHLLRLFASQKRKTVVFTIHQPASDIWHMFDKILLMVDGHFIYQGDGGHQIINHFQSIGFTCPKLSNPADYFMSIMHQGNEKNVKNYQTYYDGYDSKLKHGVQLEIERCMEGPLPQKKQVATLGYQIKQIAKRQIKILRRNPLLVRARLAQSVFLSLFIGAIYFGLPGPHDNPTKRNNSDKEGFLYFFQVAMLMTSLNPNMLTFPQQRAVFLREENAKLYTTFPYFVGKLIVDIVPSIIFPIICSLIIYWMVWLNQDNAGKFFFYMLINVLESCIGLGMGFFGGSAFSDAKVAISATPLMMMPFMLFAGFIKNAHDYMSWIGWIQYISPFKYGFIAAVRNEFEYDGVPVYPGDPVGLLDFDMDKWDSIWCLLGLLGFFLIAAFCFLSILKTRIQ